METTQLGHELHMSYTEPFLHSNTTI